MKPLDKSGQKITINNSVVLNFMTPMNRRRPFSWGRAAHHMESLHRTNMFWDFVLKHDVQWSHMITINPDPKVKDFKNEYSLLKSFFKKFFLRPDVLALYTNIVYVLEYGKKGKIHLHGLIRTTRCNGLAEKIYDKYNLVRRTKDITLTLQKINDHGDQKCEAEWIGRLGKKYPNWLHSAHPKYGWPYLRKEPHNHEKFCFCKLKKYIEN